MKYNIPCKSNPMPYYVGHVDYTTMPLTFKSYGTTNIFLRTTGSGTPTKTFYYSKNGGSWTLYIDNKGGSYTGSTINLSDGDTIAFSGTSNNLNIGDTVDNAQWTFNSSGNWTESNYLQAYGNIQSLHNWQTLYSGHSYRGIFSGSTMISSCWNVIFPNDSNLNRKQGYASVFRNSRVVVNPKMVRFSGSYDGMFDCTWYNASYTKYIGIDTPSWTGLVNPGGIVQGGVFCKTPTTKLPTNFGSEVTIINWHESDNTYWVVTGASTSSAGTQTGKQVILNDGGTITYV